MNGKSRKIAALLLCVAMLAACLPLLAGCKKKETARDGYTYNISVGVFPTDWNPHRAMTDADGLVAEYTTSGLYAFDFDESGDSYVLVPEAAAGEPQDVTSSYVGNEWDIAAGETGRAWKIPLRKDLAWENGERITAESYAKSLSLLLRPEAENLAVNSVCKGNFVIANAEDYLYSGKRAFTEALTDGLSGYVTPDRLAFDEESGAVTADGRELAVRLDGVTAWSENSLAELYAAFPEYFYDELTVGEEGGETVLVPSDGATDMYAKMKEAETDDGVVVLTREFVGYLRLIVARAHGYATVESYAEVAGDYAYYEWQETAFVATDHEATDFSEVGIKALDDGDLLLILEKPLDAFNLKYALTDGWLVNATLYESCESFENGEYRNTYGTSASDYMSYGPYKLVSFEAGRQMRFERNDAWYGYSDEAYAGLYQTTAVNVTYIASQDVARDKFLKGELDEYVPLSDEVALMGDRPEVYRTSGDDTYFIAFNPDPHAYPSTADGIANAGKAILTLPEFRRAVALSIDRRDFVKSVAPEALAAYSLFSDAVVGDLQTGASYRSLAQADAVLTGFWGLEDEVGEGKKYASASDALAHTGGKDAEEAERLFTVAYERAVNEGLMDADDRIEIVVGVPDASSSFGLASYGYVVKALTEAVSGTKIAGKLFFRLDGTLGNGYGNALRDNVADMLVGVGWTGSALDPYSLLTAYTDPTVQYDPSRDTSLETVSVTFYGLTGRSDLNGLTLSASLYDWSVRALAGEDVTCAVEGKDGETKVVNAGVFAENALRLSILAACELAVLGQCDMIPLIGECTVTVRSFKINYGSENYVYGIGRGGVKYMTYGYSDAEWSRFVEENGGKLNYGF